MQNIVSAIADGLMEEDFGETLAQIKADEELLKQKREEHSRMKEIHKAVR
jgi:hypothetical protein